MRYQECPKRGEDEEGHILRWGSLGEGCFRCAVDSVVARFGADPNCECRAHAGPFCIACEARGDRREEDGDCPLKVFQATLPPYRGVARPYAGLAGAWTVQIGNGMFLFKKSKELAALRLLASARTDPLAFDAALYLVAECVRFNSDFPKSLREWAYYAITGQIERPRQKGKYPAALIWRDEEIVSLVKNVMRLTGLHATGAGDSGGKSACAAVAEALRLLRLEPDSYTTIKRIWLSRNKPKTGPQFVEPFEPSKPDWPKPRADLIHEASPQSGASSIP